MTRAAIMQPAYLPWAGYMALLDRADVFIIDDRSQFVGKSWHCRNRIQARDGNVIWLTVPVRKHRRPLNEIEISGDEWRAKHWRSIVSAYQHAPHWDDLERTLGDVYETPTWRNLTGLTSTLIRTLADRLGVQTRIVLASELGPTRPGALERIEDLCALVGADRLINTAGAKPMFAGGDIGIPIDWLEYQHSIYDQGGKPFVSHLSIIDAIAWLGDDSGNVISQP